MTKTMTALSAVLALGIASGAAHAETTLNALFMAQAAYSEQNVRDMTADPKDAAIVMAIIQLAHSLQLEVKAEGVETEEQLRFLSLLRCDAMQGFLFCKAVPADAFEQLLAEGRTLGTPGLAASQPAKAT